MDSRAGSSSRSQSTRFPNVLVTISPSSQRHLTPSRARLAISSRIYWTDGDQDEPTSFFNFRGGNSLSLTRLSDGESWESVEKLVSVLDDDNARTVVVHGKLHGPERRRSLRMNPDVELTLAADTPEQAKRWLDEIRFRVASPELLRRHFQGCVGSIESTAALEDVMNRLKTILVRNGGLCIDDFDRAVSQSPSQVVDSISELQEGVEHLNIVDKAAAQTGKLAGGIATAVKMGTPEGIDSALLASRASQIAHAAQTAADVTGAIAGLSCLFQLIGLGARSVLKLADANHGWRILPKLLDEVDGFLRIIMACVTEVLHPKMAAEEILLADMFRVLTRTIDAMGDIEEYLMQGKVRQTMDSKMVKELESKIKELRDVVASVVRGTKLLKHRLEREIELEQDVGELHPRPLLSPYFVGRAEELEKLGTVVNKYGSAVISQCGGIGKTQLMVKFAECAKASLPGGSYWVTADGDAEQVLDSLATFVEKLRGSRMAKDDRKDSNIVVAALRKCLTSKNGKWLLCLDNVDNATDPGVGKVLDRVCSIADPGEQNGWVVVTSRQGQSTLWDCMKKEQRMELGPLSQDDAMCLLMRLANSINANELDDATIISNVYQLKESNRAEFDALVGLSTILGGLPLALVQAGTYIRQPQFGCTFSEYLKRYEEADGRAEVEELLRRSREFAPVREEQRAILTTWKISVERLSKEALDVLRALSMLGNAPMPKRLLNRVLEKTGSKKTPVFVKSLLLVRKELVHGTSLVRMEKRGSHDVYDMHRLVRLFVVVEMKVRSEEWSTAFVQAVTSTRECVAQVLKKETKSMESLDGSEVFGQHHRTWVSHALATVHHCTRFYSSGGEIGHMIAIVPIHQYTGMVLRFFGRCKEEKAVWEGQLRILLNYHGNGKHPNIASALGNLGLVLESLGKFQHAEAKHRESLDMARAIYGHDVNHPSIAKTLNNLGNIFHSCGKLEEAETMRRDVLEMMRAIYGHAVNHLSIAKALNNLGSICKSLGQLNEAEKMHREGLEMERAMFGHDVNHPSIASTLGNLGELYEDLGKLGEAEAMLRESLDMKRGIYGHQVNHQAIACTLNSLGGICMAVGKLEEAERAQREGLEMLRDIYGHNENHPLVASSLVNLSLVCKDLGKLEEAETMQRESLKMMRHIYGDDVNHPSIAFVLNDLGLVCMDLGKLEEAETKQRECLEMMRAIYGQDVNHARVASVLGNLGNLCERLGKLEEAEKMHLAGLKMERGIFGHGVNHPSIASSLGNLGIIYQNLGKLEKSEEMQLDCLKMMRAIHGQDVNHPSIASTLGNLGELYKELGKLGEAEAILLESLEMKRAIYGHGVNHSSTAMTLCNLGDVYEMLGKLDEAEMKKRQCLEMRRAIYGNDVNHISVANALGSLGNIYKSLGKLEQAETAQCECLEMERAVFGHDAKNPDIATTLNNLGVIYSNLGKLDKAETMLLECLEMERAIYGHNVNHPSIAKTLGNLGNTYEKLRRFDEAETMQRECLEMERAVYGHGVFNPSIASTLGNLANIYQHLGKLDEAEMMQRECLEMKRAIYGHDASHPSTAMTLGNLGNVYNLLGKLEDAEAMQRECLEMRRTIYGNEANHPELAMSLSNLGSVLVGRGQFQDGLAMVEEGLRMYHNIFGANSRHPSILQVENFLEALYNAVHTG